MFNCDAAPPACCARRPPRRTRSIGEVIPSDVPGLLAIGVRQPVGVVVGIAPWNAPLILGTRAVATPLAYGNTVVLKASEQSPRTHAAIASVLHDAGLPAGRRQPASSNAPEDASDGRRRADRPPGRPRRINFTGSTRVGRIIAEKRAAATSSACCSSSVGKAPLVVLADADLDARRRRRAASARSCTRARSACRPSGSWSTARSPTSSPPARLSERARASTVGDPRDPATQIGPLVNAAALRARDRA